MKFTVEIDEFWLDEDSNGFEEELKTSIKNDVIREIKKSMDDKIQSEISRIAKDMIEKSMYSHIQSKVKEVIKNGTIKKDGYSNDEITIEAWIKSKFIGNSGYGSPDESIKKLAKQFGDEMKQRYDLLFASQIVAKLNEQGLLKEDVAKLLLPHN